MREKGGRIVISKYSGGSAMDAEYSVDFAISYAGEDIEVAREIARRLRELDFWVFLAESERPLLVGVDAEGFFERLFAEAKQVIALISKDYKRKDWPRFEWDVILERDLERRFIPVRLDDTRILGLPSKILHLRFRGDNYDEIVEACVKQLLLLERDCGIHRPTEYERVLNAIKNESKGALPEAYQLVIDHRKRTPLGDCELPTGDFKPSYEVIEGEWSNFSVVRRRSVKILVPVGLSRDELRFNLQHCAASQFNAFKPDAVMVFAYARTPNRRTIDGPYTAGRVVFAPFGKWEKAQDGVAYNIPASEFEYSLDFASDYLSSPPAG